MYNEINFRRPVLYKTIIPCLIIGITLLIISKEHFHWVEIFMIILLEMFVYGLILACCIKIYIDRENRRERRNVEIERDVQINVEEKPLFDTYKIIHIKENCIICLEELEGAIQLKCGHIFHRHCLDQMIEYNLFLCPLCRALLV